MYLPGPSESLDSKVTQDFELVMEWRAQNGGPICSGGSSGMSISFDEVAHSPFFPISGVSSIRTPPLPYILTTWAMVLPLLDPNDRTKLVGKPRLWRRRWWSGGNMLLIGEGFFVRSGCACLLLILPLLSFGRPLLVCFTFLHIVLFIWVSWRRWTPLLFPWGKRNSPVVTRELFLQKL